MKKQKKSCKKVIRKSYAQLVKENLGLVYYRVNERWRKTAICIMVFAPIQKGKTKVFQDISPGALKVTSSQNLKN